MFLLWLRQLMSWIGAAEMTLLCWRAPSPNRGHLAKEGPWVPWGSWGCFGVLRFRPERASGVWLLKSKFRYLHYKFRNRPKCASTNATETEFPAVKSPIWVAGVILHANITLERSHNEIPHRGCDFRYPPPSWLPEAHFNAVYTRAAAQVRKRSPAASSAVRHIIVSTNVRSYLSRTND